MNIPFYGVKIYNENKLIRDFKPYTNKDGTVGVYDFVSNEFFKLNGVKNYKVKEKTNTECNCWRCIAERLFNARRVSRMRIGKVYLYQMYSESFEEFDTLKEVEQLRNYADKNIPYWDYDPVTTFDLNNPEQVTICRHRGWIE